MLPQLIMFDLDGTLVDSRKGIEHTLRLTLEACQKPLADDHDLSWCIGSSLWKIFEHYLGTTSREALDHAVATYRHIYRDGPMFEYTVYPGVVDALAQLHQMGARVVIATAKAHEYAREVIATSEFAACIHHVYGSELDGTNVEKQDLIRHVLRMEGRASHEAVMVGDRHHDIQGAVANGVPCIAVSYGYGEQSEFAFADATISHAHDLVPTIQRLHAQER